MTSIFKKNTKEKLKKLLFNWIKSVFIYLMIYSRCSCSTHLMILILSHAHHVWQHQSYWSCSNSNHMIKILSISLITSSQKYNSYWENKTKSSDQLIIKSVESRFQSQLSVFKQSLMITAESAILNQYCYNN